MLQDSYRKEMSLRKQSAQKPICGKMMLEFMQAVISHNLIKAGKKDS